MFYRNVRLVARIKTRGDAQGFRANQPHMSLSLSDGKGLDWQNDQAKFNAWGQVRAKQLMPHDRTTPVDFQGNPDRFVLIMTENYDGASPNDWAAGTHFPFPNNHCDDTGVDDLQVEGDGLPA